MSDLAVNGGSPVRRDGYPDWPVRDEREVAAIASCVRDGTWGGHPVPTPTAAEFSRRFAAYQGAAHGVLAANGTVTLQVALMALNIGWRDEVIVPAITFETTYYACIAAGAIPVVVDVSEDTLTLDPERAADAIAPATRAIMPVHMAHHMADMDRIVALAQSHGLAVIEDAAHAHGLQWRGMGAGCIGDFGSFSHQSSKTLTSGEGGSLLTNDERLAQLASSLIDCGRPKDPDHHAYTFGGNYRLGDLHASLLLVQLERFEAQRAERARLARYFERSAASVPGVRLMPPDQRITRHGMYEYVFRVDPEAFSGAGNSAIAAALRAEGIPANTHFKSLTDAELYHPALSRLPVAVEYGHRLDPKSMGIPIATRLTRNEVIFLDHRVFLSGERGVTDVVEALAKIRSHAAELEQMDAADA